MANNNSIPPEQSAQFNIPVQSSLDIDERPTMSEAAVQSSLDIDERPTLSEAAVQKLDHSALRDLVGRRRADAPTTSIAAAKPEEWDANFRAEVELRTSTPIIAVRDLKKTYLLGQTHVRALRGVSLEIYPGEFVAIMGPSGSGKSTFMNLIGCLDRPTEGEYWLAGRLVSSMSSDELADIRNRLIGFVFQGFNLLGRATALANAALPLVYAGFSREARTRRARTVLKVVGLGSRMNHKPAQLSGGQQQRVAIARALVNGPALLLADEPTGNLDSRTSLEVMAVLQALNQQGLTIVLVTHEPDIAAYTKRQIGFVDGRIVRDERVLAPRSAQKEWMALAETKPSRGVIHHAHGAS